MAKIILVTGDPRSGTSLMMNILIALGIGVVGEKFPMEARLAKVLKENPGLPQRTIDQLQRRIDHAKTMNPMGFWEDGRIVTRGLKTVTPEQGGKAVKIITAGAWLRPTGRGTDPACYDKAILCLRDPRSVAVSQEDLIGGAEIAGFGAWEFPKLPQRPNRYLSGTGMFARWLADQPQTTRDRFLPVDYDQLCSDPTTQIRRIVQHLGLNRPDIAPAVAMIDTNLRRSQPADFPENLAIDGAVAMRVYQALKSGDDLLVAKAEVAAEISRQREEAAGWIDTEYGTLVRCNADLARSLAVNSKEVRTKLLATAASLDYRRSPYYGGESDQTYTIKRAADLGDLTRKRVICTHERFAGEHMTIEHFAELFRRRFK